MELARDRITTTELGAATLESKIYNPEEAARVGYLDAVVPAGDVVAKAMEEATRLGGLSKMAYAATKSRLRGKTIKHIVDTLEADMASMLPS
jgi:enoyl-CoA hydratase/carnithine racemase